MFYGVLLFSAPAASNRYFPIKELTTWTPRWVILGRVVDKGPVNSFRRQDGAAGKIGSVDIMDRDVCPRFQCHCENAFREYCVFVLQGDSIRAKFWGDAADKWIPYLQQGQARTWGVRFYTVLNVSCRMESRADVLL